MEQFENTLIFNEIDQAVSHLPTTMPLNEASDAFDMVCDDRLMIAGQLEDFMQASHHNLTPQAVANLHLLSGKLLHLELLAQDLGRIVAPLLVDELINDVARRQM